MVTILKRTALSLLLMVVLHGAGFGWGAKGHHMVADMAYSRLNANVKDSLKKYIGDMTIGDAATWMDPASYTKEHGYMKTWHYINIEKGGEYKPVEGARNVVTELTRAISALKNRKNLSKDSIALNVKIVLHLCGDITQPMHGGYPDDLGGNTIKTNKGNLHKVWDSIIIDHDSITVESCEKANAGITKQQLKSICKIDAAAWLNESRTHLANAYDFKDGNITDAYLEKNRALVEQQLFRGGVRLAAVLNEIFSK